MTYQSPKPRPAPRINRSVHVGVNYAGSSSELAGCIPDAKAWHAEAAGRGFDYLRVVEVAGALGSVGCHSHRHSMHQ